MAQDLVHYAVLDEEGFRQLVRGEVVRLRTSHDHKLELALSDIGWGRMEKALVDALAATGGHRGRKA